MWVEQGFSCQVTSNIPHLETNGLFLGLSSSEDKQMGLLSGHSLAEENPIREIHHLSSHQVIVHNNCRKMSYFTDIRQTS